MVGRDLVHDFAAELVACIVNLSGRSYGLGDRKLQGNVKKHSCLEASHPRDRSH
jgi:hypothetical protein